MAAHVFKTQNLQKMSLQTLIQMHVALVADFETLRTAHNDLMAKLDADNIGEADYVSGSTVPATALYNRT